MELTLFLESVGLSYAKFGVFSHYISDSFLILLCFSSPSGILILEMSPFWLFFLIFCSFCFILFPLYYSDYVNSVHLLRFTDSILGRLHSTINPISQVSILAIVFFSSLISTWLSFTVSISLLRYSILHSFQENS